MLLLSFLGLFAFGGWWAFVRPAQRMQAFCAEIEPGMPLSVVYDRSIAAGFESFHAERLGFIVYARNGTDTASCVITHAGGRVEGARYDFP